MPNEDIQTWLGRTEEAHDIAATGPLDRLAALLDRHPDANASSVRPLGHWLYFLPQAIRSELGEDGHPKKGGFLPPIDLPRRMWAGGRISFEAPIRLTAPLRRVSRIAAITEKVGKSGPMVFVTVVHEIHADGVRAITEEQDLVYRAPAPTSAAASPPKAEATSIPAPAIDFERRHEMGPVDLFRFSALTFNSHRIHFDRDYATAIEGYPGLVVHGPFIATLLMDLFVSSFPQARVTRFSFRAESPLFDSAPFHCRLRKTDQGAALWAETAEGRVAMRGDVFVT